MKVWTYLELATKVAMDLDVQNESFVQTDEMIGYYNEAVEEAEAEICKLSEDYFLTDPATIAMVAAQQEYDLPTDVYIQKIRRVLYHNNSRVYPITRMRGMDTFTEEEFLAQFGSLEDYQYRITSPTPGVYKIRLFPTSREAGAFIKIHYLRSALRVATLASGASQASINATLVDIPEFASFIMVFMKAKIRAKDFGGQIQPEDAALVQQQRDMMTATLSEREPDDDNTVIGDYSAYWEHN